MFQETSQNSKNDDAENFLKKEGLKISITMVDSSDDDKTVCYCKASACC